jgi:hypothetical protein
LARKLIGHERVDVTRQLIATGPAVMVSVHIAVVGSIIGTVVASIAALVETVRCCAIKSSFAAILAICAWTLCRTATT